jgi:2-polyprenyl-3-methyl-5-hydroxy-6-metoxy-1,4-benzoquinol methylase
MANILKGDDAYWSFCEDICGTLNHHLFRNERQCYRAAEAYNELCLRMLRDQIQFRKTGVYQNTDARLARRDVYENKEFMSSYMMGLLFTQLLWPNHYQLFRFFQSAIRQVQPRNYLEIGAGHGLFVMEALRQYPSMRTVVCDVSQASIDICRQILQVFTVDATQIEFVCADFFECDFSGRRFDFITAGEILEHLNDASGFLRRLQGLLKPRGKVFLTTCANCPAPDHVYRFHNVDEIRGLLKEEGFIIEEEMFLPAEDVPVGLWEEELITINYGVLLRLKKTK